MVNSSRNALAFAAAVVCAALVAGNRTEARQDPLPPAREIVARHVAAIGGEAAFRAVRSIHARGRLEIPAQGIGGDLEVFAARPDKLLYRANVTGIGRIENGYDGQSAWSMSSIAGPELLKGRQLSETADDAWFDSPLHLSDHVRELTTVARTEFDGHPAYRVKVVFASGNEQFEYYDMASGLQIGSEATRATPQGPIPTVNVLRNYQKFGPLLQATVNVQRAIGLEQVVTITACEYDSVPDAVFEPPAEIRALLQRP
jgi:hypothetical protein